MLEEISDLLRIFGQQQGLHPRATGFDLGAIERVARAFDAMASSARIPVSTAWGSVLNYTLFGSETAGLSDRRASFSGASASLEARMFSPYGTLTQTGIVGTTTTRDMTMLRLDTGFAYSHPETLITYRIGDSISTKAAQLAADFVDRSRALGALRPRSRHARARGARDQRAFQKDAPAHDAVAGSRFAEPLPSLILPSHWQLSFFAFKL